MSATPSPSPTLRRRARSRSLTRSALLVSLATAACADPPDQDDEDEVELELAATYKAQVKNGRLSIIGNNAASKLTVRSGATSALLEVDVGDDGSADFTFDRSTFDSISIDAGGGDDTITILEQLVAFTAEEQVTINGGAGNDTIRGGAGAETISGGAGNDVVAGHYGADVIMLGTGDDTYLWYPGSASDVVDGEGGIDKLTFSMSNVGEVVELAANGDRLRLTRDIASIVLDLHAFETVDLQPLGGTDRIVVNDLLDAFVAQVNVDLAQYAPGQGDGVVDTIVITGTTAADTIDIGRDGDAITATGLSTMVSVANGEPALDRLLVNGDATDSVNVNGSAGPDSMSIVADASEPFVGVAGFNVAVGSGAAKLTVNGLEGDDVIAAQASVTTPLVLDGGDGNDTIYGAYAADVLRGGAGTDTIDGGMGADAIDLGDGDDTFVWTPGDFSDVVEGGAGTDTLDFHASGAGDTIDLRANGSRVHVYRNISLTTTDLGGVERIDVRALGGADTIVVNPLSGTSALEVNVKLAAADGSLADTQADQVVINGDSSLDAIDVAGDGSAVVATGLGATVRVFGGEPALDRMVVYGKALTLDGTANADVMTIYGDASGAAVFDGGGFGVLVAPSAIADMTVNGMGGDDQITAIGVLPPLVLAGGDGNDTIYGGHGADQLLGGAGNDTIDGGTGVDTVHLGDGDDTFVWTPGDASDVVDGELGADALVFHASNAGDGVELRANGARAQLLRNIGTVTMDLGTFERVDVKLLGSTDTMRVGDLTGTSITQVNLDLAASGTSTSDAALDALTVVGAAGPDAIAITGDAGGIIVSGLAATVRITAPDVFDQLAIHGQDGVDTFTVMPGLESLITLSVNQD